MQLRPSQLDEVAVAIWYQLQRAVEDRSHPWRNPVLATVDGERADARVVVLREVDPAMRQLRIYTDQRAGKVRQIVRHPQGSLVMWSAELGWQLRCRVLLDVESSGLSATSRWARIRLTRQAQDYLSPHPPGTPLDTPSATAAGVREHFAVIGAQVLALDWLELHADGHRRAIFDDAGARWIQP